MRLTFLGLFCGFGGVFLYFRQTENEQLRPNKLQHFITIRKTTVTINRVDFSFKTHLRVCPAFLCFIHVQQVTYKIYSV